MTKKHLYMAFQGLFGFIFMLGFFMPLHKLITPFGSTTVSMVDKDNGTLVFVLYLLLFAGTIIYTYMKDDIIERGTLFSLILLIVWTVVFLIEGLRHIESGEFYSISVSFAPFYLVLITALMGVYYYKHPQVLDLVSTKIDTKPAPKKRTSKDALYAELERINDLYKKEVLTEEEYRSQKALILKKLDLEN